MYPLVDYWIISPFGSSLMKVNLNPKIHIHVADCTHHTRWATIKIYNHVLTFRSSLIRKSTVQWYCFQHYRTLSTVLRISGHRYLILRIISTLKPHSSLLNTFWTMSPTDVSILVQSGKFPGSVHPCYSAYLWPFITDQHRCYTQKKICIEQDCLAHPCTQNMNGQIMPLSWT